MNKRCVFFGLVLVSFALMLSLVSGEIVSSSCEREQIGSNKFQLSCFNQSQWIQDEAGNWQDFNRYVEVNFRNREIFIEWEDKVIELNPFVVYNGNKWYTQQIPDHIWTQVNWQKVLSSKRGFFKFAIRLKRIDGLTAVGFDVNSNAPIVEVNRRQLWAKFGKVGINFRDLLADFNVSASRDGDKFVVLIYGLPNADELDLDPVIVPDNDYDNEVQKFVRCILGFGCLPATYSCSPSAINPWRVGYDRDPAAGNRIFWRSFWQWDTLSIPTNATITDVDVSYERIAITGSPDSFIMATASKPEDVETCATRWVLIDSSTIYESVGVWGYGWNDFDLGEDAVSDLQGHLTWFATGLKHDSLIVGSEDWVGLGNVNKYSGAILTVVYSLPPDETDEFEEGLIKRRVNWVAWVVFVVGVIGLVYFSLRN
jgi:hypothetical protein